MSNTNYRQPDLVRLSQRLLKKDFTGDNKLARFGTIEEVEDVDY